MTDLIRQRLKTVPDRPGCYLMRDRRGTIIYIGKAKNLRKRVQSYFRPGAKHAPKVRSMVRLVYDFEFMTVKNEAESLLTESALIKRYKPHFNILLRDDKRYLSLRADGGRSGRALHVVGLSVMMERVISDRFLRLLWCEPQRILSRSVGEYVNANASFPMSVRISIALQM